MNKYKFLNRLNDLLQELSEEDRNDILNFYYERFDIARYEGKSDQELIDELESAEVIAHNILVEYASSASTANQVKRSNSSIVNNNSVHNNFEEQLSSERTRNTNGEDLRKIKGTSLSKVLALILVDVLILSALTLLIWIIPLGFLTAGLAAFPLTAILPFNYDFIDWLPTSLAYIGAGLLLTLLAFSLGKLALKLTKKIIILNVKVCAPNAKDVTIEKIKNWHAFRRFKNERRKRVFTGFVSFLGIGLIVSGVITMVTMNSAYYRMLTKTYRYSADTKVLENLNLVDNYDLNLSTGSADILIDFLIHDENYIKVEYDYDYTYGNIMAEVVNSEININLDIEIKKWWEYTAIIRPYDAKLTVTIPNNLNISTLQVTGEDSYYNFKGFSLNNINIDVKNSVVNLNKLIVANDITVASSNEKIIVNNTTASTLNLKTSNSKITVNNAQIVNDVTLITTNHKIEASSIKATNLTAITSNAPIQLSNCSELAKVDVKTTNYKINLKDIYAKEVALITTNAKIDYRNSNKNYQVDLVTAATTTNNRIIINVTYGKLIENGIEK